MCPDELHAHIDPDGAPFVKAISMCLLQKMNKVEQNFLQLMYKQLLKFLPFQLI